jgi:nitrogen permease regulator 3-like protein
MAETLLAILLVTSSAKGSSLVYRWPPDPACPARLARPRPDHKAGAVQLDNPGRAAYYSDLPVENKGDTTTTVEPILDDNGDYEWKRPSAVRDRSMSISRSVRRSSSGRSSPSESVPYDYDAIEEISPNGEYDDLFGYSSEFLAGLLCPQRSLCHQKFELVVDELAFIGHPVCAEEDGTWRFKPEKYKSGSRGRGSRNRQLSQLDETHPHTSTSPSGDPHPPPTAGSWLKNFHLVFALDLPDPSSSASGNVSKYFDIIYEQIAFTVTAVLFQEQVLSNFVEAECEVLGSLKDEYISKGMSPVHRHWIVTSDTSPT